MPRLFISYRRADSAPYAGRICDRLRQRFGAGGVFMDVDSIRTGQEFEAEIRELLPTCDAVFVLIGPNWLNATDARGVRRLLDPEDLVHLEVAMALSRDVLVFPVLLDGARMPQAEELPAALAELCALQATELTHRNFDADFARLLRDLDTGLAVRKARQQPAKTVRVRLETGLLNRHFSVAVAAVSGLAAILVLVGASLLWRRPPSGEAKPKTEVEAASAPRAAPQAQDKAEVEQARPDKELEEATIAAEAAEQKLEAQKADEATKEREAKAAEEARRKKQADAEDEAKRKKQAEAEELARREQKAKAEQEKRDQEAAAAEKEKQAKAAKEREEQEARDAQTKRLEAITQALKSGFKTSEQAKMRLAISPDAAFTTSAPPGTRRNGRICCLVKAGDQYLLLGSAKALPTLGQTLLFSFSFVEAGRRKSRSVDTATVSKFVPLGGCAEVTSIATPLPSKEIWQSEGLIAESQIRVGDRVMIDRAMFFSSEKKKRKVKAINARRSSTDASGQQCTLDGLIVTEWLGGENDYGAPVKDQAGRLVGLLYESSGKESLVVPIGEILKALGARLP